MCIMCVMCVQQFELQDKCFTLLLILLKGMQGKEVFELSAKITKSVCVKKNPV